MWRPKENWINSGQVVLEVQPHFINMWEFLHSASQFLNINTYKHTQTHAHTQSQGLFDGLFDWMAYRHGYSSTPSVHSRNRWPMCNRRHMFQWTHTHAHARTHTALYSHKDGYTNGLLPFSHTNTRTHGCAPAQREGIEQPAAYVPLVREHSFKDRRGWWLGWGLWRDGGKQKAKEWGRGMDGGEKR